MKGLRIIVNKNSNIFFDESEYDNFSYDGRAIILEKEGGLVATYSIANIIGALSIDEKDDEQEE